MKPELDLQVPYRYGSGHRYGITWVTGGDASHSYAQTGYEFTDIPSAIETACRGPWYLPNKIDPMCIHYPDKEWPLYYNIETEDEIVAEGEVDPMFVEQDFAALRKRVQHAYESLQKAFDAI